VDTFCKKVKDTLKRWRRVAEMFGLILVRRSTELGQEPTQFHPKKGREHLGFVEAEFTMEFQKHQSTTEQCDE
jgi:hypothetical protein